MTRAQEPMPESVLDTLEAVRADGRVNMMDLNGVVAVACDLDCDPSAIMWLHGLTEASRHDRAGVYTEALRRMGERRRGEHE